MNGWRGLLIEPREEHNNEYYSLRPNSIIENYALVGKDFKDKTIKAYTGDVGHMFNVTGIHGTDKFKYNENIKVEQVEWKTSTLDEILRKHNIKNVDFFSLDVEGYEHDVLNGIDFEYVQFGVILIESHDYTWCGKTDDFSYLEKYGYNLLKKVTSNHQLWINNNFELN